MQRIAVKNLSKEFKIGFKKDQTILQRVLSFFSGREPKKTIKVIDEISFGLDAGKILGIIGKNGSGKSTLLRIIAGIYQEYEGSVSAFGKVIPIINLNIGLNNRLTMRDNIFLVGSLFGISRKNIEKKMDSIIDFSGLNEFVNTKIYQFSSGMRQRLAFSIAIHAGPEILLLDEVFEVGDEDFRKKSADKIKELARAGASIILVTHDLDSVQKHCDEAIFIENGKIAARGNVSDVVNEYKKQ